MTNSVCAQLSAPDANGLQNCSVWVEDASILPAITQTQASTLGMGIVLIFATAWGFKQLGYLIRH